MYARPPTSPTSDVVRSTGAADQPCPTYYGQDPRTGTHCQVISETLHWCTVQQISRHTDPGCSIVSHARCSASVCGVRCRPQTNGAVDCSDGHTAAGRATLPHDPGGCRSEGRNDNRDRVEGKSEHGSAMEAAVRNARCASSLGHRSRSWP